MKISIKILHWLPRILCILSIGFISLFALDAFAPGLTFWQQIGDFLIHLIPSIILSVILIIAWNRELIGGIIFIIIGVALSPSIFLNNYRINKSVWTSLSIIVIICIPFVIVGILFLVSHFKNKKKQSEIIV